MEEAPENGKELLHSAHANGMNEWISFRSQWPRGLRRGSAASRLLGSRVRIQQAAWMSVSCECCVLKGRSMCVVVITRPEQSYRVWSRSPIREVHDPEWGRRITGENKEILFFRGNKLLAPRLNSKRKDSLLSAVRLWYSVYSQLTLISEGPFLHPQPEGVPIHTDKNTLVMVVKPDGKRPFGSPRYRQENNIKSIFKK
jgi:hypothetical protein